MVNIGAGLSGLKAAADLTRMLRDGLKSGEVKPDDIAGRIGEIYDYIVDSKDALVEAKDEITELKDQLRILKDTSEECRAIQKELTCEDNAYFRVVGEKRTGPFCTACWDDNHKLIRLTSGVGPSKFAGGLAVLHTCAIHKNHQVPMSKDYSREGQ